MLTATQISTDRSTQHSGRCKQHYCPHPVLPSGWWRSISGTYICGQFLQERDSDAPVATYSVAGHRFLICVSSHVRTHILDSFMARLRDPPHLIVGTPASSSDKNIRMSLLVVHPALMAWNPCPSGSHLLHVPHSQHMALRPTHQLVWSDVH